MLHECRETKGRPEAFLQIPSNLRRLCFCPSTPVGPGSSTSSADPVRLELALVGPEVDQPGDEEPVW